MGDELYIKAEDGIKEVKSSDLLWLKAFDNYVKFRTKTEEHIVRATLSSIEAQLDRAQFIKVHRSYIINLTHLEMVSSDYCVVTGEKIPVSRSKKKVLLNTIMVV